MKKNSFFYFALSSAGIFADLPNRSRIFDQPDLEIVTSFAANHPFKANAGGFNNLNDKSDVYPNLGFTQSAMIQTDGKGLQKRMQGSALRAFNFQGKLLKLWLKVDNVQHASDISFFLGNRNFQNYVRFNLKSSQGQKWITEGDWVAITLSWNKDNFSKIQLSPRYTLDDLKQEVTDFRVQIRDQSDGVPVSLHINRISIVADEHESFQDGVISLTFDDSWASQYWVAGPILRAYGYPATAYTIVGFLDTPSYLTLDQLRSLEHDFGWEISLHANDGAMHMKGYDNFAIAEIEKDILQGRQWLIDRGFGFGPNGYHGLAHFAYPKGNFRSPGKTDVLDIARRHFLTARSINERHHETVRPADPHKLRVLYVTAPKTAEDVIASLNESLDANEWVILVFHQLVEVSKANDEWEIEKFERLIDYIGTELRRVPVLTVGDVCQRLADGKP